MFNRAKNLGNLPAILKKAQKSQKNLQKVQDSFKNKLFEKRKNKEMVVHMTGEFKIKNLKITPEFVNNNGVEELLKTLRTSLNKIYDEVDTYRANELEKVNSDFDQATIDQIGKALGKNVADTLKKAQEAQVKAKEFLKEFKKEVYESEFAQGNIKITMKGSSEITKLEINNEFVDTEDMEMLEDSLIYALNNMYEQVDTGRSEALDKANEGLPTNVLNGTY